MVDEKKDELDLNNLCEEIIFLDNIEDFLNITTESVRKLLDADRCTLFIYDKMSNSLKSVVFQANLKEQVYIPLDKPSIAGYVFENKKSLVIKDVKDESELKSIDPNLEYHPRLKNINVPPTKSMIGIPLNFKDEIIGVLTVVNYNKEFKEEDKEKLLKFSKILGLGLKNLLNKIYIQSLLSLNDKVINNVSDAIIITDNKDKIVNINNKILEITGFRFKKEEILNKNIFDLLPMLKNYSEKIENCKKYLIVEEFNIGIFNIRIIPSTLDNVFEKSLINLVYIMLL